MLSSDLKSKTGHLVGVLAATLILQTSVLAASLGTDKNSNGIWDDLETVYMPLPEPAYTAAQNLARNMQEFTLSPPGNISLGTESMRKTQESLLCLYAVAGENAAQVAKGLQATLLNHRGRAERFLNNQITIQGQELPFEADPQKWGMYCPFPVPRPAM